MIVENPSGKSVIRQRTRSETGEHALLFKRSAIAIDFPDNAGSIGRYCYCFVSEDVENEMLTVTEILNTGNINPEVSLDQSFHLLFELLEPGKYFLSLSDFDISRLFQIEKPTSNYYPSNEVLLWTQPVSTISDKRVDYYINLIEKGYRPIVVITGMRLSIDEVLQQTPFFILDGHHKIAAYLKLGIIPKILLFERVVDNWTEVDLDYFPVDEELYNKAYSVTYRQ